MIKEDRAKNKVIINGIKLSDEQVNILFEAINGGREFGLQYEYYLEEEENVSVKEQNKVVNEIYDMFNY